MSSLLKKYKHQTNINMYKDIVRNMRRRAHHIKFRMQMQIICIRNPIILSDTLFVKPFCRAN